MIKKTFNLLTFVTLCVLIINSFFIYPSADDFSYFVKQKSYGFWAFQEWHYFNWGGRYIANMILGSFDFNEAGLHWYRSIAVFIILGFYISLVAFTKQIIRPKDYLLTTNLMFLAYCFSLYSLSQEFYWMPGSITYTLSLILCLISWTLLEKSKNWRFFLINIILIILLNGTNEISSLIYNGSLFLYLLYSYIKTKNINRAVFTLLIFSVGCMLISILAAGNTVRTLSEKSPNTHDVIFSISRAIFRTVTFTAERLFIFLILGVFLFKGLQKRNLKMSVPKIPTIILKSACVFFPFLVLCFGIFPSYYATGRIPPERTVNTVSFFFLISIVFSIQFYKDNFIEDENIHFKSIINYIPILLLLIIVTHPNDLRNNFYDLFSGRSLIFAKEMEERDQYLKSTPEEFVTVKKISVIPNTLLFKDISGDPTSFFNYYYARFYNKKSVSVHE